MAADTGDRHPMLTGQPLILVVGMHRSGTSLLTGMLQQLQVAVPGELIRADQHNPEGYYEAAAVTALQERLLQGLERWWPGPKGMHPLPSLWQRHPASQAAARELRAFLEQHQPQSGGAWAIKDPRTSLLLPLWRRVAAQLGIPLRLVLAIRDPREVEQSLCQRDAEAAGMTPERAAQLWWHHNRQVLRHGKGLPLLCLDYSRWFSAAAAEQLQQLAHFVGAGPLAPPELEAALAFVKPEHRRSHKRPAKHHALEKPLQRFYRQLQAGELTPPRDPLPTAPPNLIQRLRSLSSSRGWFDPDHYRSHASDLPAELNLGLHERLHGRKEGRSSHPLKPLVPNPLVDQAWLAQQGWDPQTGSPPSLAQAHPWGAAALALSCGDLAEAAALLGSWLELGIPADEAALISQAPSPWLPWLESTSARAPSNPPSPSLRLALLGQPLEQWPVHGWLNRLPGLRPEQIAAGLGAAAEALPTQLLSSQTLPELTRCREVRRQLIAAASTPGAQLYEARPEQVQAWQRLNLNAAGLGAEGNGWLAQPGDLEAISAELGLPAPAALPSGSVVCLGSAGEAWERELAAPLVCIPQFDAILQAPWPRARLLAAWLLRCEQAGHTLVRINPSPGEDDSSSWLTHESFSSPLHPEALQAELTWRQCGRQAPLEVHTPQPQHQVLFSAGDQPARVAICISLYNYANRIEAALNSAAAQTLEALELIVVDDQSSDGGEQRVLQWMQQHQQRFSRVQLLQHSTNGGLAAARNTAFAASSAPWCFVLDADNTLLPEAATACLAIAEQAPANAAVVHPLVEVRSEASRGDSRSLISGIPWQREQFRDGNVVDAMALIRRSAWEACGGFHHIPGGWEDFDFWCCLIDAGYHGVLCPQRLAIYNSHAASMISQHTDQGVRAISRLLQQRHPWLQLPMATGDR